MFYIPFFKIIFHFVEGKLKIYINFYVQIWARSCENVMPYTNNKGADQPVHPRSLINTFIVRCLDSMICILAISKVSRFYLASLAEQAGLNLTWSQISIDTFSYFSVCAVLIIGCLLWAWMNCLYNCCSCSILHTECVWISHRLILFAHL